IQCCAPGGRQPALFPAALARKLNLQGPSQTLSVLCLHLYQYRERSVCDVCPAVFPDHCLTSRVASLLACLVRKTTRSRIGAGELVHIPLNRGETRLKGCFAVLFPQLAALIHELT